jgi:hypothetical protein
MCVNTVSAGSDALGESEGEMVGFAASGGLGTAAKGKPPHLLAAGVPFFGPYIQGLIQAIKSNDQCFVGGEPGFQFHMLRQKLEIYDDLDPKNPRISGGWQAVEEVGNQSTGRRICSSGQYDAAFQQRLLHARFTLVAESDHRIQRVRKFIGKRAFRTQRHQRTADQFRRQEERRDVAQEHVGDVAWWGGIVGTMRCHDGDGGG